jgi:hypothetical protein
MLTVLDKETKVLNISISAIEHSSEVIDTPVTVGMTAITTARSAALTLLALDLDAEVALAHAEAHWISRHLKTSSIRHTHHSGPIIVIGLLAQMRGTTMSGAVIPVHHAVLIAPLP